ncbi:MAG: serine/threonine protein kinase [Planctomycetota bacterium]|nr:MAG: serine/threonine protein kinase [Planctomycetota bacterium]
MIGRLGPYLLERELGAGAMGVVYQALHPGLRVRYALKVLRPELCAPRDAARFQRELESMAAVSQHPHVVRVHSAGFEHGRLYYVMDLVDGEDLQKVLNQRGRLPPRRAAEIGRAVASALAALHRAGFIHRDLKPENILIERGGRPLLTDFGLARAFADERGRLTQTGELVGTPAYMAPEQALGERDLSPAADVYASGAVLYTLLAGRPPVTGTSKLGVLSKVATGDLEPLAKSAPDVPLPLAELCAACLRTEATRRPSAQEVERALDAYLSGKTVPLEGGPTAGSAAKRHRLTALFAGLCALGGLLGVAAVVVVRSRQEESRRAALPSRVAEALRAARADLAPAGDGRAEVPRAPATAERLAALRARVEAAPPERTWRAPLLAALHEAEGHLALATGRIEAARVHLEGLRALRTALRSQEARALLDARAAALGLALDLADERLDAKDHERWSRTLKKRLAGTPQPLRGGAAAPPLALDRRGLVDLLVRHAIASGREKQTLADLDELGVSPAEFPAPARARLTLAGLFGGARPTSQRLAAIRPEALEALAEQLADPTLRAEALLASALARANRGLEREDIGKPAKGHYYGDDLLRARDLCAEAAPGLAPDAPARRAALAWFKKRIHELRPLALEKLPPGRTGDLAAAQKRLAHLSDLCLLLHAHQHLATPEAGEAARLDPEIVQRFEDCAAVQAGAASSHARHPKTDVDERSAHRPPSLADVDLWLDYRPQAPELLLAYAFIVNEAILEPFGEEPAAGVVAAEVPSSFHGDPEKALARVRAFVELQRQQMLAQPTQPEARNAYAESLKILSRTYRLLRRAEDEEKLLDRTLAELPEETDLITKIACHLSLLHGLRGNPRRALAAVERALEHLPESVRLRFERLHLLNRILPPDDRTPEGDRLLDAAWEFLDGVRPDHPDGWNAAERALFEVLVPREIARGNPGRALEGFERVLAPFAGLPEEQHPGFPRLLARKARLLLREGDLEKLAPLLPSLHWHLERCRAYEGLRVNSKLLQRSAAEAHLSALRRELSEFPYLERAVEERRTGEADERLARYDGLPR